MSVVKFHALCIAVLLALVCAPVKAARPVKDNAKLPLDIEENLAAQLSGSGVGIDLNRNLKVDPLSDNATALDQARQSRWSNVCSILERQLILLAKIARMDDSHPVRSTVSGGSARGPVPPPGFPPPPLVHPSPGRPLEALGDLQGSPRRPRDLQEVFR